MKDLMQDPMFLYTVAFVIFLMLAYRFARKPLVAWIDTEILKIRDELEEARKLRTESEVMLAQYKSKQIAALSEAEAIIRNAKDEAARLQVQAAQDLKSMLERHEQQALERIRITENEAMADVRAAAINMAMEIATKTLSSKLDETTLARLTDQAIAEMPKRAATKAEAA